MLTALEQGVKGGCWFRLWDKVFAPCNLTAAYEQVARNQGAAGVDHVTVKRFGEAQEAQRALELIQQWTAENGLVLHPTKTKIVDERMDGFDFLGYRLVKHRRFPRRKSLDKFKAAIRAKTKRTSGDSLNQGAPARIRTSRVSNPCGRPQRLADRWAGCDL